MFDYGRRWTDAEIERLKTGRRIKEDIYATAICIGRTVEGCRHKLRTMRETKRYGLTAPDRGLNWGAEQRAEVRKMMDSGKCAARIASVYGRSKYAIWHLTKGQQLRLRLR